MAESLHDGGASCGSGDSPWPVCSKPAGNSAQGLCDLAGNVSEWVADAYGPYAEAPIDGSARAIPSKTRVARGGNLNSVALSTFDGLAATTRSDGYVSDVRQAFLGFRVAR